MIAATNDAMCPRHALRIYLATPLFHPLSKRLNVHELCLEHSACTHEHKEQWC